MTAAVAARAGGDHDRPVPPVQQPAIRAGCPTSAPWCRNTGPAVVNITVVSKVPVSNTSPCDDD